MAYEGNEQHFWRLLEGFLQAHPQFSLGSLYILLVTYDAYLVYNKCVCYVLSINKSIPHFNITSGLGKENVNISQKIINSIDIIQKTHLQLNTIRL